MNDREQRLRARIDQLTDERDKARIKEAFWHDQTKKLRQRIRDLEQSRETWRNRWLTTGIHGRWRKQ
jgi:hypothetical protein